MVERDTVCGEGEKKGDNDPKEKKYLSQANGDRVIRQRSKKTLLNKRCAASVIHKYYSNLKGGQYENRSKVHLCIVRSGQFRAIRINVSVR